MPKFENRIKANLNEKSLAHKFRFQDGPFDGEQAYVSSTLHETFTFRSGRFEGRYVRYLSENSVFRWQPRYIISND
jgi:hypothetical protein